MLMGEHLLLEHLLLLLKQLVALARLIQLSRVQLLQALFPFKVFVESGEPGAQTQNRERGVLHVFRGRPTQWISTV